MDQEKPPGQNLFIHLEVFGVVVAGVAMGGFIVAPEALWIVASLVAGWAPIVLIHAWITPVPSPETLDRQISLLIGPDPVPPGASPITVQVAAPSVTEPVWATSA